MAARLEAERKFSAHFSDQMCLGEHVSFAWPDAIVAVGDIDSWKHLSIDCRSGHDMHLMRSADVCVAFAVLQAERAVRLCSRPQCNRLGDAQV